MKPNPKTKLNNQIAVFGGGCFWCTEAVFSQLKGVTKVTPGYAGGHTPNPTYNQVCQGKTGHAEVIEIQYNPTQISYNTLLQVFWNTHNPTLINRQGPDTGSQYRSIILTTTPKQKHQAQKQITRLNQSNRFQKPIATQLQTLKHFYPAENNHHNYFQKNPQAPYCQIIINPKLRSLKKKHSSLIK